MDKPNPNDDPAARLERNRLVASAWNIVGAMIACSAVGYWLGGKMGDVFWGAFFGALLGLIYAGYEIWKVLRKS